VHASALDLCAYYLGAYAARYGASCAWDHTGWLPLMAALIVIAGWRARGL
jgi:hypothetical protein